MTESVPVRTRRPPAWAAFIKLFGNMARYRSRFELFTDFVTLAAISLHNATCNLEHLETEYLKIMERYEPADREHFSQLLAHLVDILQFEPWDALGAIFMELELGDKHRGQFFTPSSISEFMARLTLGTPSERPQEPFLVISEPSCGAGGMILACAKVMIEQHENPAQKLWVHCQDVDRKAAMMCFIQLSLWGIPGVVVVGNTLTLECREAFYTPMHYMGGWDRKLAARAERMRLAEAAGQLDAQECAPALDQPAPLLDQPAPLLEQPAAAEQVPAHLEPAPSGLAGGRRRRARAAGEAAVVAGPVVAGGMPPAIAQDELDFGT